MRRRIIVNFTHDPTEAFEGILWGYRGRWLTLKDATALKAGPVSPKLPGEILIHRSQIAFLQVLP